MAFNDRSYLVLWRKLAIWLLPILLRRKPNTSFVSAAVRPTDELHKRFTKHREYIAYWLGINSQMWRMEKALNDRFDMALRRIKIVDAPEYLPTPFYQPQENKPVKLYQPSEDNPLILYTMAETAAFSADFIVEVSVFVNFNMAELMAFVDSIKLPSKTYKVKIV